MSTLTNAPPLHKRSLVRATNLHKHAEVIRFGHPINWSKQYLSVMHNVRIDTGNYSPLSVLRPQHSADITNTGSIDPTHLSADAIRILPDTGAVIFSADCPTVVISGHFKSGEPLLFMLHCSRDALFDKTSIVAGNRQKKSRTHMSIIDAVIKELGGEVSLKALRVYITLGIGNESFIHDSDHPTYGDYNKKLHEWIDLCVGKSMPYHFDRINGSICLENIIKSQLTIYGIPAENIMHDGSDTFADVFPANNVPLWWSHRRWVESGKKGIDGRNAVVVIHQQ